MEEDKKFARIRKNLTSYNTLVGDDQLQDENAWYNCQEPKRI